VDPFGYTPFLYAATDDFGDFEAPMTLLTTGNDPNFKGKKGKTAPAHAQDSLYANMPARLNSRQGRNGKRPKPK